MCTETRVLALDDYNGRIMGRYWRLIVPGSGLLRRQWLSRERNHVVVMSGPYRYVRHPGYVGMTAFLAATPVALGSRAAFVPESVIVLMLVLRTALEDRTLRKELPGYAEYAAQVRYRLLPRVW